MQWNLYILLEAWSRTTGIPTVFYIDSFRTLLASLLHKDTCYDVAGFPCRSRYWSVGTAAPGSGKNPSLEPLKEALLEVLREHAQMAPGVPADNFHVQQLGTHAAAVDKSLDTRGYQFFGASVRRTDTLSCVACIIHMESVDASNRFGVHKVLFISYISTS